MNRTIVLSACLFSAAAMSTGCGANDISPKGEGGNAGAYGHGGSGGSAQLSGPTFPRLDANFFGTIADTEASADALAAFGVIKLGGIYSKGKAGGADLGKWQGLGSWSSASYNLSAAQSPFAPIHAAKLLNPELVVLAHRGLAHIEASYFDYGKSHPNRWFVDRLSPRWLAYTPLMPLSKPVAASRDARVFMFPPAAVKALVKAGVKGADTEYWAKEDGGHDWHYLSFFDNEAGAGRGTIEIMAIKSLDPVTGAVEVAKRMLDEGKGTYRRAVFGRHQSYAAGHRAGLISHSLEDFGSLSFLMNRRCAAAATAGCDEAIVDGVGWLDANVEYAREILMASRHPATGPEARWLVDGIVCDADDLVWQPQPFSYCGVAKNQLDLDFDGKADQVAELDAALPSLYEAYGQRLREAASALGRDFVLTVNGNIPHFPLAAINGRRFEDFNGGFQESYARAVTQYADLFAPGNLAGPVLVSVNERDRDSLKLHNFEQHRHILALTLVLGDGFYGHTGSHATRLRAISPDLGPKQPDDWFDELSVDPSGYSADHPSYQGATRRTHVGWLGRALGPAQVVTNGAGKSLTVRQFEHGVAVYAQHGGGSVRFEPPLRRICGVDPDNDGGLVSELKMTRRSGVILRRDQKNSGCK